jgi:hypothetical protein
MKTILHYYRFDRSDPEYKELCQMLKSFGLKKFDSISSNHHEWYRDKIKPLDGKEVTLETEYLFNNQWNTVEGLRVFDWAEAIYPNRSIKEGQWLEQTDEMREIRDNTKKCGYCGEMSTGKETFCNKCLDSQYLEQKDLHLLRMLPVSDESRRPKLTEDEAAVLVPLYEAAQGLGKERRDIEHQSLLRKKVANLIPEAEKVAIKVVEEAKLKTEAFTWLLDKKFRDIDNVIYYSHTKKFCFGWSRSYSGKDVPEILKNFPFSYEVK